MISEPMERHAIIRYCIRFWLLQERLGFSFMEARIHLHEERSEDPQHLASMYGLTSKEFLRIRRDVDKRVKDSRWWNEVFFGHDPIPFDTREWTVPESTPVPDVDQPFDGSRYGFIAVRDGDIVDHDRKMNDLYQRTRGELLGYAYMKGDVPVIINNPDDRALFEYRNHRPPSGRIKPCMRHGPDSEVPYQTEQQERYAVYSYVLQERYGFTFTEATFRLRHYRNISLRMAYRYGAADISSLDRELEFRSNGTEFERTCGIEWAEREPVSDDGFPYF